MSRVAVVRAQHKVTTCARCPLAGSNVPMVSPAVAPYAVLGEAPGGREVQKHEPFVGPAGRRLRRVLAGAGLDPDAGAYLNVVSCLPGRNPPTPEPGEVAACTGNRVGQLAASEAPFVLACGNVALRSFGMAASISTAWGWPFIHGEVVVVPSIHPAAVLRDPGQGWKLERAVERLAMLVTGVGLEGTNLLGTRCMACGRGVEVYGTEGWAWCGRHRSKVMSDKQRSKMMRDARTRSNEKKQGVMF